MRLLGIDYGSKRVGTALSNEDGDMAFPHKVYENNASLVKTIGALVEAESVSKIVIGHSLDLRGDDNPIQEKIDEFIGNLTLETGLPIELEPEQYSTQEAAQIQGKTDTIDASAAAIILNSYITKQKNTTS